MLRITWCAVLAILGLVLVSMVVQAVEYSHDAKIGDLVQVTLEDGSTFEGTLTEKTEARLILTTEDERTVLLQSTVAEIVVLPRQGQNVRLLMVDGTQNTGQWAGEDDQNVYLQGKDGRLAFLKSQVKRIEPVRGQDEQSSTGTQGTGNLLAGLSIALGDGIYGLGVLLKGPDPVHWGLGLIYENSWSEEYMLGHRVDIHVASMALYGMVGTKWVQALLGFGTYSVEAGATSTVTSSYTPTYAGLRFKVPVTDQFALQISYLTDINVTDVWLTYLMWGIDFSF